MAQAMPASWHKVRAQIEKKNKPTLAELELLQTMGSIFEEHCRNALSMTT